MGQDGVGTLRRPGRPRAPASGHRGRSTLAAASWMLLLAAALGAQETSYGSIAGRVVDEQAAPVPGAVVTLSCDQGSRQLVTDSAGQFLAPYLTPGAYLVRVELAGFAPVERPGVLVRLGLRVELPFRLQVGTVQEVVQVDAESPVVDMSSTTAGSVLDSAQLLALPVSRRFTETLYMAPGVSDSSGVGAANPSIGGASGLENHYVVDGINITNVGYGAVGPYTGYLGSLGTGVTTDFIQETQVKTAGFEAEYGQTTGGVVNVVTKSGTNAFHGSVFGYWHPPGLEAAWRSLETPDGVVNTTATETVDFGVGAGGPLVKDRLFAFASFNPQYDTRTLVAPDDPGQFPLAALGEVDRHRRTLAYAAKLTWQLSATHRLDATVFGDPARGEDGPQRDYTLLYQDETGFSSLRYGGHNQALRYSGVLSPGWMLEGLVGHAGTFHEERPTVDETRVSDRTVLPLRISGGLGRYESGTDGSNWQASVKSTHLFRAGGRHEVRYGVAAEDISYTQSWSVTGPNFTFPDGTPSIGGTTLTILRDPTYGRVYVRNGIVGAQPETAMKYLSLFAQDTWQVGRLTVRPGLRWERQHIVGGSPICFSDEQMIGGGGSGPPVKCEYTWSGNWAPRLGATFDLRGDGKAKLYASVGRFYVKMPNDLAARAISVNPTVRADYFDEAGTQPIPEGVLAAGTTWHFRQSDDRPALLANDTRLTHSDELVGGVEVEVAPALSLGVRYVHRDLSTVLEDYSPAQVVLFDLGYPGLQQVQYLIDNISSDLPTIDASSLGVPRAFFEDPVHTYDSIEVTATKAFSGQWSLVASYRWSRLRGNFDGFYRADNGQSDPALTSLFDFPTNDPSYTEIGAPAFGYLGDIRYQGTTLGEGRLPNDRPHQLKIYATWAWRSLNLGAGLYMGSGRPLTALAANPFYGNGGEIPMTLRGTGMQTQDGFRVRAPGDLSLDLHADRAFRLGPQRLVLVVDVFNVFDNRAPAYYDHEYEIQYGVPNPDFGYAKEAYLPRPSYRAPRQTRVGARFEW